MFMVMKNGNKKGSSLLDQLAGDVFSTDLWDTGYRYPAVDIYEENGIVHIDAEVPGMTKENLCVGVEEGVLTISGERKKDAEEEGKQYYRTERKYGSFTRSFTLGEKVDDENISAVFENGILKVSLPVKEDDKPVSKRIEIK